MLALLSGGCLPTTPWPQTLLSNGCAPSQGCCEGPEGWAPGALAGWAPSTLCAGPPPPCGDPGLSPPAPGGAGSTHCLLAQCRFTAQAAWAEISAPLGSPCPFPTQPEISAPAKEDTGQVGPHGWSGAALACLQPSTKSLGPQSRARWGAHPKERPPSWPERTQAPPSARPRTQVPPSSTWEQGCGGRQTHPDPRGAGVNQVKIGRALLHPSTHPPTGTHREGL